MNKNIELLGDKPELSDKDLIAQESADQDPEFVQLMEEFSKEQQLKYDSETANELNVNQFFKQLPRKMKRKMMKNSSFSNQFRKNINSK